MASDYYQVEILHYLNPNLIWVEVLNSPNEISFEQLGVYGILPIDASLDVERPGLKLQRSEDWMPATAILMKNIFQNLEQVWFSPTHIDRRSSIFDNNIHKYGELIIKKNGVQLYLSKELVKAGLATEDPCQFHQYMSLGKIKTKLSNTETRAVIKNLEEYYRKSSKPKELWQKSVHQNTSIFHAGERLQALTVKNLERHNNRQNIMLLENKLKDLEQCKGSDEVSLGRGVCRVPSNKSEMVMLTNKRLKNRLELLSKINMKSDATDAVKSTKRNFSGDGQRKNFENDFESDDESVKKVSIANTINTSDGSANVVDKLLDEKQIDNVFNNKKQICYTESTRRNPVKKAACIVYGPPSINIDKLPLKEAPKMTKTVKWTPHVDCDKEASEVSFGDVDSHVKLDVKNLDKFHEIADRIEIEKTIPVDVNIHKDLYDSMINNKNESESKIMETANLKTEMKNLRKSSILQSKLKQFDKFNVSSNSAASESSTKSSMDSSRISDEDDLSSDDEMSEIMETFKLNLATPKKSEAKHTIDHIEVNNTKLNANPFKNLDGSKSVFVDKLTSPVLLVHTKRNNKVQPCSLLRDVPFGTSIHVVLRNMGIKHPTRLQTVSWGTILRGLSTFLISPPRSGKTMGYLPAVCRLVRDFRKESPDSCGPKCIIVCATSKSVSEVERISKMLLGLEDKVFACYSGMDNLSVTTALLNGCDLLICTPKSIVRLLQNDLSVDLRDLTTFVVDDCERISDVYSNEVKYVLYEIKNMLKNRVNKELKVQIVVASRIWCDFLEPIVLKAPDSVVCIGAFQELILYSKISTTVDFLRPENKIANVLQFIDSVQGPKRTVVVCRADNEVKAVESSLRYNNRVVFACDNTMNIHDLYNLNVVWGDFEDPTLGPILVCCDSNLVHLNVTDASYLIHYSLPALFSTFCKRFSVLNDNYPSIFKNESRDLKVKVLMDESNVEQLPKILNFLKRCTENVPKILDEVSEKILNEKDLAKVKDLVPLCDNLLSLGICPDTWNCTERHRIFKECDSPADWIPKNGVVTFQILYFHSAVMYSARLLSNTVDGETTKYPQTYSTLSLKMGMYFSKESSRRLHGIPMVGDVCAVSKKQNFFIRCQVVKIISFYKNGNPNYVVIKLIDEEKFEQSRDIYLYHLPDEFKDMKTYVVQVRLANIQPQDKDITFSCLAKNELEKIVEKNEDLFMRGHVAMSVGSCIFVDTLEACLDLSSLSETVVRHNFKQELLNAHAVPNPKHLSILEEMCEKSGLIVKAVTNEQVVPKPIPVLPAAQWAHLEDDLSSVYLASVEDMDKLFVRLVKFESCMKLLNIEINKYVSENTVPLDGSNVGDIVLAKFPDDSMYERARIDHIYSEDKVKCFFVDQGDWRDVSTNDLATITENFITQLPFQAIECRLIGIRPFGEQWTEFSTNWFSDHCFEDAKGNLKHLYVKHFTKEKADCTGGHKYGVALIDTYTNEDIIVNQLLIDLNLAKENVDEIAYLSEIKCNKTVLNNDATVDEEEGSLSGVSEPESNINVPLDKVFLKAPIRSVPLVDSEYETSDSDTWQINRPEDFKALFMRTRPESSKIIPMITANEVQNNADGETSKDTSTILEEKGQLPEKVKDDELKLSKPKICWSQNKNTVKLKILIAGIEDYKLKIEDRAVAFSANHCDVEYGFKLELYGVVDVNKSRHSNKGQYVLVTMTKLMCRNWLALTKEGDSQKWIVYDVDTIEASSDEEVYRDDTLEVIKNIHNTNNGSDSEDDDFLDDVS
ncbi:putative ATP-dependent RNA helicase TDRD12 [Bombyx mori]|uniref:Putative ATP-dependent RNA helicase TDRD12 n=1 Tax=Bombyx mori TaxID=7091 RepID=TDR12_BOMMO|nr:putative ATP-dependent RNA helicase TDRD12 [Bombyx mori]Q1XG89.2 RecName: Full=Putative ATP-dependent RNA helicase TDRD12; AltName: Full=RNA helicase-like protein; AltName: Full=Tudor domain-containing protein 12; Short=BmTdrd12 [Bombyx mori]